MKASSQHVALHLLQKTAYVPNGQLAGRGISTQYCALHCAGHVQAGDLDALESLDDFKLTVSYDNAIVVSQHYEGSQTVAFVFEGVHRAKMRIFYVDLVCIDGLFGEMALWRVYGPQSNHISFADGHCIESQVVDAGAYCLFGVREVVAFVQFLEISLFVGDYLEQLDFAGPSPDQYSVISIANSVMLDLVCVHLG